jgi:hypothetical protein
MYKQREVEFKKLCSVEGWWWAVVVVVAAAAVGVRENCY